MTDGTPARVTAINTGLRMFKPDLLRVIRAKSLWHRFPAVEKLWEDTIEFHKFESVDVQPFRDITSLDAKTRMVVEEVKTWKKQYLTAHRSGKGEIDKFWLRKTGQPILGVIMTQKPDRKPKMYRAMNMEVSMPTGSLYR
eukprot:UN18907